MYTFVCDKFVTSFPPLITRMCYNNYKFVLGFAVLIFSVNFCALLLLLRLQCYFCVTVSLCCLLWSNLHTHITLIDMPTHICIYECKYLSFLLFPFSQKYAVCFCCSCYCQFCFGLLYQRESMQGLRVYVRALSNLALSKKKEFVFGLCFFFFFFSCLRTMFALSQYTVCIVKLNSNYICNVYVYLYVIKKKQFSIKLVYMYAL